MIYYQEKLEKNGSNLKIIIIIIIKWHKRTINKRQNFVIFSNGCLNLSAHIRISDMVLYEMLSILW